MSEHTTDEVRELRAEGERLRVEGQRLATLVDDMAAEDRDDFLTVDQSLRLEVTRLLIQNPYSIVAESNNERLTVNAFIRDMLRLAHAIETGVAFFPDSPARGRGTQELVDLIDQAMTGKAAKPAVTE